ncbi:hypothetical protein GGTG_03787 [Gaeumannomyces tritici R3-111a-1]|uniref:Uncharacterized protein n=1 Tax=Gaeumannomyces tritici (strain R3-111a-1) TaxID=644352 RepID=J3NR82_GAET3|nr:hypothetical protein GGTG_03787 [Gaeumannomyces tritici R3-111a-1]EJT78688.1 hypothetical protein GGTG_03787 [Gaeumannomyces tritici R3-111a-1]
MRKPPAVQAKFCGRVEDPGAVVWMGSPTPSKSMQARFELVAISLRGRAIATEAASSLARQVETPVETPTGRYSVGDGRVPHGGGSRQELPPAAPLQGGLRDTSSPEVGIRWT